MNKTMAALSLLTATVVGGASTVLIENRTEVDQGKIETSTTVTVETLPIDSIEVEINDGAIGEKPQADETRNARASDLNIRPNPTLEEMIERRNQNLRKGKQDETETK